jgi:hypothetical protein
MAAINATDPGARVAIMEKSMVSLLRNFAF